MIYCVTDIGSNTVKCNIYEYDGKEPKLICFRGKRVGLIDKVIYGILPKKDIDELCELVNKYKTELDQTKNPVFYCFGTQALRAILNLDEVISAMSEFGIELDILSGEDEARLSFLGFTAKHNVSTALMADMGGGSTELVCCRDGELKNLHSFPFGCLYLRSRFVEKVFPTKFEQTALYEFVYSMISEYDWIKNNSLLGVVGGTANAIKKLIIHFNISKNGIYSIDALYKLVEMLSNAPEEYEEILTELLEDRVDTVLPGAIAYKAIADYCGAKEILISDGGVRDGYLYSKLGENK